VGRLEAGAVEDIAARVGAVGELGDVAEGVGDLRDALQIIILHAGRRIRVGGA